MEKTSMPPTIFTHKTVIPDTVFVADGARVTGDVRLGDQVSIWFNAVLRGDINFIQIGDRTNIQDNCVCHLENDIPCIVGSDVTVGHNAILHGCTVEDGCLIGMGAIVLNGARIGKGSIIGAGAVVKEHMVVPPGSLVVGIPGKIIRDCGPGSYDNNVKWAAKYVALAKQHKS